MGEAKNRHMRAHAPSACVVGEQKQRRGEFPLPSGKRLTVLLPEPMSSDDAQAAAAALVKLAMGLVEKAEGRPFEPTVPEHCALAGTPDAHTDVSNAGKCASCLSAAYDKLHDASDAALFAADERERKLIATLEEFRGRVT